MEKVEELIRTKNRFLVTTHNPPDGDGIGASMALHLFLKKSGKESYLIHPGPTPEKFSLVDPKKVIQVYQKGMKLPVVDVVFILDTNETKMLGSLEEPVKALKVPIVFVDHHIPELKNLEEHLVDESYGATGELVFQFLRHLRADIDADMALALYVAIFTDTGGFKYKRTSARTHEIVAELLKKGVRPESVFHSIYARESLNKMRLLGYLLESVETSKDQKVAWLTIPKQVREKYGASVEDTESYINQLTLIRGLEVAVLFREEDDGKIKLSFRGVGEVPVVGIAKKFGGGGHRHAAGARLTGKLEEIKKQVIAEVTRTLEQG